MAVEVLSLAPETWGVWDLPGNKVRTSGCLHALGSERPGTKQEVQNAIYISARQRLVVLLKEP